MQKIEFKDYPDTSTLINAENLKTIQDNVEISINEVDIKNTNLKNQVVNGWYEIDSNAVPTFTFVSYDSTTYTGVVNSNLDLTSYLMAGMKIKFTQNSAVKYAFITAITSTQLTLFLGTDYSINNSAISNTYYSMLKTPYGFPIEEDKWSVYKNISSGLSITNPIDDVDYNIGNLFLSVPIGKFKVKLLFSGLIFKNSTEDKLCIVGLSNDGSMSNAICNARIYTNSQNYGYSVYLEKSEDFIQKTNLYLLLRFKGSLAIAWIYKNDPDYTSIPLTFQLKATCAYL